MGTNIFNSVSELHRALGLPAPLHPLISLSNYADITADVTALSKALVLNMYKISFKFNFSGRIKYGQQYYDFSWDLSIHSRLINSLRSRHRCLPWIIDIHLIKLKKVSIIY